jgi:hypothetical protein
MAEPILHETLVDIQRTFAAGQDAARPSKAQNCGETGRSDGPSVCPRPVANRVRRLQRPRRSWR